MGPDCGINTQTGGCPMIPLCTKHDVLCVFESCDLRLLPLLPTNVMSKKKPLVVRIYSSCKAFFVQAIYFLLLYDVVILSYLVFSRFKDIYRRKHLSIGQ